MPSHCLNQCWLSVNLLTEPFWIIFNEISRKKQHFNNISVKMFSAKCQPFCSGLTMLINNKLFSTGWDLNEKADILRTMFLKRFIYNELKHCTTHGSPYSCLRTAVSCPQEVGPMPYARCFSGHPGWASSYYAPLDEGLSQTPPSTSTHVCKYEGHTLSLYTYGLVQDCGISTRVH